MTDQNSYVEFILGTYKAQLVDCAQQYPELTKEFDRDYKRLSSAVNCHGIRFALDTMPAFRKHFDKCLSKKRLIPSGLLQFGVGKKGGTIPRLFRGLVLRVFDSNGLLRLDADKDAIRWIRQLLGVVRKLKLASSKRDVGTATLEFFAIDFGVRRGNLNWGDHLAFHDQTENNSTSFTDMEKILKSCDGGVDTDTLPKPVPAYGLLEKVQQVADYLCSKLGHFDPMEWRPRHGHGAVSDQAFGSYRYEFKSWPDRLEHSFPYADFAVANYAQVELSSLEEAKANGYSAEWPAKLCAVPKTLSKPRLIASEPANLQWCQQTIRDYFYNRVSATTISAFIDFGRQDKNGTLALEASHDASHSTIDLSSASDRVSCWHVERLFRRSPALLRALQASRSIWLTQGICRVSPRLFHLRKYSTMGNATTFPVQSLFFLSLALGSLLYVRKQPVCDRVIRALGERTVRVFGDDIVIPEDGSDVLLALLDALELKVNTAKTFTEGNFRESCGVDAFDGYDVTTVSILEKPRRASPGSIVSSVDVQNNLCDKGYAATAAFIQKTASHFVQDKIRYVEHGSGLFGWSSLLGETKTRVKVRHSPHLHRAEVRCVKLRVSNDRNPAREEPGLLQYFIEAPRRVTSAVSTLGFLSRRPKAGLTLGWVPMH